MTQFFPPARRNGLILHIVLALLLAAGAAAAFWYAFQQQVGLLFALFILLGLLLVMPFPLAVYRGYALLTARYVIERDGLRLRWGLRAEDIPLPEVEWLRSAQSLAFDLPLPRLAAPGAIIGVLNVPDLGAVEYMASDRARLLLLATPRRVYAISPLDPAAFVEAFRDATEMGSLAPIGAFSARPAAFLRGVLGDAAARWMLVTAFLLTVALFTLVSLLIPGLGQVSLGFDAAGLPVEPSPASQLMLLPILGILVFIANVVGGLYFYRYAEQRPVAYLLWAAGMLTPALLLAAVLFLT